MNKKQWYDYIPHPVVMLFGMLVMAAVLSYIIPAGSFDRVDVDGRMSVVPGSYKNIAQTPLSLMDMFFTFDINMETSIVYFFILDI